MGWIGTTEELRNALERAGAAKDENGNFLVRNGNAMSFMGVGVEVVLTDDIECSVAGEWEPLVPLLGGGLRIKVF